MTDKKRVAIVIAPELFHDHELEMPMEALKFAGAEITIASTTLDTCRGVYGTMVDPDTTIDTLRPEDFDALMVTGGHGAVDFLFLNEPLLGFVREMNGQGKVVASICSAGGVLANSGILKGKKATGYNMEEVEEAFQAAGVELIKDEKERGLVIEDGNILTGSGPEAVTKFTAALLRKLDLISEGVDKVPFSKLR